MFPHEFLLDHYKKISIPVPHLHFVLGSGLSTAFDQIQIDDEWSDCGTLAFADVPGMNPSTAPGHQGLYRYLLHKRSERSVVFQVGRLHAYEGLLAREVVQPVMSSLRAGTKTFILTNAAGSLRRAFKPGSVMLIEDQVNLTGNNPLLGSNPKDERGKALGPRFPDMSAIYDGKIKQSLKRIFLKSKFKVHEGIYLGLLGPAYETPAEVALYAQWGLGAVGMSTVWEAIALKHAGATIGGLSYISNLGCGLDKNPLSHEAVEKIGRKIAPRLIEALLLFAESEVAKKK